jgi:hypothetical protein
MPKAGSVPSESLLVREVRGHLHQRSAKGMGKEPLVHYLSDTLHQAEASDTA